jgi:predicted cytidylate kinase
MKKIYGIIFTVVSSAAFGVMPIFVKMAYSGGTNVLTVVFLRFFLASVIILPYILFTKKKLRISREGIIHIICLAIIGYSASAYTLFISYNYITVGLATTLHFIYPVTVTVFAVILYKEKLYFGKILALGLSLLGIYMLVGNSGGALNFKGIAFAISSGFFYAYYIIGVSHSKVNKIDIFVLTFYLALIASLVLFTTGMISGGLDFNMKLSGFLACGGIALVSTVLALTMFLMGIKIIGPSSAAILSTLEPIVSIVLGVLILKEQLSFSIVIGCVLILFSVLILTVGQKEKDSKGDDTKLKITITGDLYSGKSTVAKAISEALKYTYFSVGDLQRKLAIEKGMSITEYNKYMLDNNLDHEVDNKTMEIGKDNENFIFDARLAWNFIPDSFKIYLKVDVDVSVQRAMKDDRGKSEKYAQMKDAMDNIIERRRLEVSRFKEIYDVDFGDESNYDLVIDTSHVSTEAVIREILEKIKVYENSPARLANELKTGNYIKKF